MNRTCTHDSMDVRRAALWRSADRILCVRLDDLGDVMMTTPAIRALRQSNPDAHLALLTSAGGAAIAPHLPEVDEVIEYDAPWVKPGSPASADEADDLIDLLYGRGFDAAVMFNGYSQSALPAALACWLARIPLRLAHCRENPCQLLTDWVPEMEPQVTVRHEVRRQLDLLAHIGCATDDEHLSFHLDRNDMRTARVKLQAAGVRVDAPVIVVHPGATSASQRYEASSFGMAISLLAGEGHEFIVTGSAGEESLADEVLRHAGSSAHNLAGRLTLGEFASVIDRAELVISNNSAPVHLAAALGTPIVDIYALTNPQHMPWMFPHRLLYCDVPCRFCYHSVCQAGHHECLRGVTPDEVAAAARELLLETADARSPFCREAA